MATGGVQDFWISNSRDPKKSIMLYVVFPGFSDFYRFLQDFKLDNDVLISGLYMDFLRWVYGFSAWLMTPQSVATIHVAMLM